MLCCVEHGSRTWGFSAPDSDYDIRFIYVRDREHYLRLDETRDVIEWQLDDEIDMSGWDLKKTLSMLHESNPAVFEYIYAPSIYHTTAIWERIIAGSFAYFHPIAATRQYYGMAKKNYRGYLRGASVLVKKYLYVLRPLMACRWLMRHGTFPPLRFEELMTECLPQELHTIVNDLLARKRAGGELGETKRIDALNIFIEATLDDVESYLRQCPSVPSPSWDTLNELFLLALV